MSYSTLILIVLAGLIIAYFAGQYRARSKVNSDKELHSLPTHYGSLTSLWVSVPALLALLIWGMLEVSVTNGLLEAQLPQNIQQSSEQNIKLAVSKVRNIANNPNMIVDEGLAPAVQHLKDLEERAELLRAGVILALLLFSFAFIISRIKPDLRARTEVESIVVVMLFASSAIAVLTTIGIVASVLYESIIFFGKVSPFEFLFGTSWSPQIAIREGQAGSSGSFGAIPLFAGTLLISLIAMLVSVPVGLMSAIYLSEYASSKVRSFAKPTLEVLAGIPTVVYGFFAALTVAPIVRDLGVDCFGLDVSSQSALAAGLVMGIMIIPFVSSLSDDVINAVPQAMRDGSYGLGATRNETIRQVIIPAALPGIVGAIMLAISRAIGETMIVAMAAGLAANLTANPLDSVTTVTVQIVTLLTGDQEFDSAKTLAAFALGLVLFVVTLTLNFFALKIVQKYREQYD